MASNSNNNNPIQGLNLGKFRVRIPDPSEELGVGAFWRRLNQRNKDNNENQPQNTLNSNHQSINNNNNAQQQTSVQTSVQKSSSLTSQSDDSQSIPPSSSAGTVSSSNIPEHSINKRMRLEQRLQDATVTSSSSVEPPNNNEDSQATDVSSDRISMPTQIPLNERPSQQQEVTHESVIINVNPETYRSSMMTDSDDLNFSMGDSVYTPFASNKRKQKKKYPKQLPYDKILSDVTFVLSGYENPRRGKIRDMAMAMGANYSPNWNRLCTHLICAFKNTPKFKQVISQNGRIVREHWINQCSKQSQLLDWRAFKIGDYQPAESEEEVDLAEDLDFALARSEQIEADMAASNMVAQQVSVASESGHPIARSNG